MPIQKCVTYACIRMRWFLLIQTVVHNIQIWQALKLSSSGTLLMQGPTYQAITRVYQLQLAFQAQTPLPYSYFCSPKIGIAASLSLRFCVIYIIPNFLPGYNKTIEEIGLEGKPTEQRNWATRAYINYNRMKTTYCFYFWSYFLFVFWPFKQETRNSLVVYNSDSISISKSSIHSRMQMELSLKPCANIIKMAKTLCTIIEKEPLGKSIGIVWHYQKPWQESSPYYNEQTTKTLRLSNHSNTKPLKRYFTWSSDVLWPGIISQPEWVVKSSYQRLATRQYKFKMQIKTGKYIGRKYSLTLLHRQIFAPTIVLHSSSSIQKLCIYSYVIIRSVMT